MNKKSDIIYSLSIEDVQTVARDELDRELTRDEINKIIDDIADRIHWYDAISAAIKYRINELS